VPLVTFDEQARLLANQLSKNPRIGRASKPTPRRCDLRGQVHRYFPAISFLSPTTGVRFSGGRAIRRGDPDHGRKLEPKKRDPSQLPTAISWLRSRTSLLRSRFTPSVSATGNPREVSRELNGLLFLRDQLAAPTGGRFFMPEPSPAHRNLFEDFADHHRRLGYRGKIHLPGR